MNPASSTSSYDPQTAAKWWVRFNWDAEANRMSDMSVAATGLMFKLRAASWVRYGIPTEEESLKRILKFRCGIRLKKFRQLWVEMEHLFFEKDGFWFFIEDEKERGKVVDISAKRKEAGQKGSETRWNEPAKKPAEAIAIAITDNNNRSEERDIQELGPQLPLPIQDCVEEEAVAKIPEPQTPKTADSKPDSKPEPTQTAENGKCHTPGVDSERLTDEEYEQFCTHCANSDSHPSHKPFTIPGRKLAERIKAKYKIKISTLPKFAGQLSAAMWDSEHVTTEQIDRELARVKEATENPPRKPSDSAEANILAHMIRLKGQAV